MRKDKKWLKDLINEEGIVTDMHLLGRLDEQYWKNENIKINKGRLFYLIDQLDEPEVPVVPQFVADYIERAKPRHDSLYQAMEERAGEEVNEWVQAFYNSDKFARAWLDGYEVEKEKLYRIKFSDNQYASRFSNEKISSTLTDEELAAQYTEAEIKAIDERFWSFAEEVTE